MAIADTLPAFDAIAAADDLQAITKQKPASRVNGAVAEEDAAVSSCLDAVRTALPSKGPNGEYDREKLKSAAQKLVYALETPGDTAQRIVHIKWNIAAVRIANRLNILHNLVGSHTFQSCHQLAEASGADPALLIRLLRYLVAAGVIAEPDVDRYAANNITRNLTVPALEAGVNFHYDTIGYASMALSGFLQRTGFQNPTDAKNCAFQDGHRTEDSIFEWLSKRPKDLDNFNQWMTGQRDGRANWLDFFPLDQILANQLSDDAVSFVDVGGANGHEINLINKKYGDLPGRFILQDLPETLKQALQVPGMETMAHNFFERQPVYGAKCYYIRNCLLNWSDANCHIILAHLVAAMEPGYSRLLINENVLPNKGASLHATSRDMTMMAVLGATERTEAQWREMLKKVGLKVERIYTHKDSEGVIVAVKE